MNLLAAVDLYLGAKRSLGAVISAEQRILRSFIRAVGDIPLAAITVETCSSFCMAGAAPTQFSVRKHYALHAFFRYLRGRGEIAIIPLPTAGPRVTFTFEPYIYSLDELRRLLDATEILATSRVPLPPQTVRMLLLVLYAAGLRAGEGLRLERSDVDLAQRTLVIRNTKFFKSRVVPIGSSLTETLHAYCARQPEQAHNGSAAARFFTTAAGKTISLAQLENAFVRVRRHAGIQRPSTDRWQPRLHDMRHSFAVHRLLSWYRAGIDVQAHLPLLATYLGHVNLSGTQKYLTLTPQLLAEAAHRFERYAEGNPEVRHD